MSHENLGIALIDTRDCNNRDTVMGIIECFQSGRHHHAVELTGSKQLGVVELRTTRLNDDVEPILAIDTRRFSLIEAAPLSIR